ncbi:MAG: hypothetical protein Q9157_008474 [Trypethelium eluteriae]
MNGNTDHFNNLNPPQVGGTTQHSQASSTSLHDLSQIHGALDAVYSPHSTNDQRQEATAFLEQAKRDSQAPHFGYGLASDQSQPASVRHYGLSLLEYPIKYKWEDLEEQDSSVLRSWVIQLAQNLDDNDAAFLRNKIAQLLEEVAKRSWAVEWLDLDTLLVELWQGSLTHKVLVLYVLEMLSDDIFNRDDAAAALREKELSKACVDIFVPTAVLNQHYPSRDVKVEVRCGDEGWISRLCGLLDWSLDNHPPKNDRVHSCIVKTLSCLKAAVTWIMPKALHATRCLDHLCKALSVADVGVQMATTEVLYAFYKRTQGPFIKEVEYTDLFTAMLLPDRVNLLKHVYQYSTVDIRDLDYPKYALCKKFTEVLSSIGEFIEERPSAIPPNGTDLTSFFDLLVEILRSPSLVVSIPVLHAWTRLLRCRAVTSSETVTRLIPVLLETCSSRLLRYESLPDDADDDISLFLCEDFDTVPERHAFLGNYRRYCMDIVEVIVRLKPFDVMYYILGQAERLFSNPYEGQVASAAAYGKKSIPFLRVEAQVTIIEAALKGYLRWLDDEETIDKEREAQCKALESYSEQWCRTILTIPMEDPAIKMKIIQTVTMFATKVLLRDSDLGMWVVEYLLSLDAANDFDMSRHSEAAKSLEVQVTNDLGRLAILNANNLLRRYDQIETRVKQILNDSSSDERRKAGCQALLFTIVQRATILDDGTRGLRLQAMLQPVKHAWQTTDVLSAASSYESFCAFLGLDQIVEFMTKQDFDKTEDWATCELNAEGKAKQAEIMARCDRIPLRLTKTMLAASTEKLKEDSSSFKTACLLWTDVLPVLLPSVLRLIGYSQAFTDLATWSHLPTEYQRLIRKVLTDRFWQAGISNESKEDFYARINGSRTSYEGFASTVRGSVRQIRETCYFILYGMTRLQEHFFGIPDLAEPLAQALFTNANGLSAHQLSVLLSMSSALIEECPRSLRPQFLPPMMINLFTNLDNRISADWDALERQKLEIVASGLLVEEMKSESILRQLTYSTITLIANILDHPNGSSRRRLPSLPSLEPTLRTFVLSHPAILEPLVLFSTHALRMRDIRSCTIVITVLRSIIPSFQDSPHAPSSPSITPSTIAAAPQVREFISTEVLKACITSLHEPYFVDLQRELASLIASILLLYGPTTSTPRDVLLSLPGMSVEKVDRAFDRIIRRSKGDDKYQRAVVLDLLEGLRGVSIHEQGRMERSQRRERPKVQQRFMEVDSEVQGQGTGRAASPDLAGVADMFGDN